MSFRGYDPYLVSRVGNASGNNKYLTEGTIRWHNSYCGATGVLQSGLDDEPRRLYVIVESSLNRFNPEAVREYRAVAILFTDQGPSAREEVDTFYVSSPVPNRRHAEAAMRRYLADVASQITKGETLDDAVRSCVEA